MQEHDDEDPEERLALALLGASAPGEDEQGDHGEEQEARVQRIAEGQAPEARGAPEEAREIAARQVELARVLPKHEVPPHAGGVRVEGEPGGEHREGDRDREDDPPRVLRQEGGEPAVSKAQVPPGEREARGHDERERLVQQREADRRADQERGEDAGSGESGSPQEEQGERQEEPEDLGRVGQERAPVAERAEEGEEGERRPQPRLRPAREPEADREDERRGEKRVDDARVAKPRERPVPPAVRGRDALPEQQRRLGVAQASGCRTAAAAASRSRRSRA